MPQFILLFLLIFSPAAAETYRFAVLYSALPELEWSKRLTFASQNLGWECFPVYCKAKPISTPLLTLTPIDVQGELDEIEPDFVISLWDNKVFSDRYPHFLCVTGGTMRFHKFETDISEVFKFKGILYACDAIDFLKGFYLASGKQFQGIKWYPSCEKTDFVTLDYRRLFCCGWAWGENRQGEEYTKMFTLLAQTKLLDVYGPEERWQFIREAARGFLPFDGSSLRQAIREAGIALVLHSSWHIEISAPSSRIFEAVAASAIAICDQHPFIQREFGDSVLYVDHTQPGEEMFKQIQAHIAWILSHPDEAEAMARRAHQIFLQKFTLEGQLELLGEFFSNKYE